ncbi:MAG: hypothetical protein RLZZ253_2370 [Verrucomicrobiota bacterium]
MVFGNLVAFGQNTQLRQSLVLARRSRELQRFLEPDRGGNGQVNEFVQRADLQKVQHGALFRGIRTQMPARKRVEGGKQ